MKVGGSFHAHPTQLRIRLVLNHTEGQIKTFWSLDTVYDKAITLGMFSLCSPLLVIFCFYIYERFFACFELMCTYSAKLSIQETNRKRMSSVEFVGTLKNSEESKNL